MMSANPRRKFDSARVENLGPSTRQMTSSGVRRRIDQQPRSRGNLAGSARDVYLCLAMVTDLNVLGMAPWARASRGCSPRSPDEGGASAQPARSRARAVAPADSRADHVGP